MSSATEIKERLEFFLSELSVLPRHLRPWQVCGYVMTSPSFWTLPKNALAASNFTEKFNQVVHNTTQVSPFKQAWIAQVTPAEREEVWYVNICITQFEMVLATI